jgi:AcrR family transcriptional regulator
MSLTKRKRTYNSPHRRDQAEGTRRKILQAARRLFAGHGYTATTLADIAQAAGVSVPTVTAGFGTKLALLDALIKSAVRGTLSPIPLAETPGWRAMLQNRDPIAQLRQYAANTRHIREQTADIVEIVHGAATADPEIAALLHGLSASRLKDNHLIAQALARNQALGLGMTIERATDLLWTLGSAEVYRLLVVERGWLPEVYEQWLVASLIEQLLKEPRTKT